MIVRSVVSVVLLLLLTGRAFASTEIGLYDARSVGMGGTGVAYLDSAGAIPVNPALLDQVDTLTLSLNGLLIAAQPEAPYKVYHLDQSGNRYFNYETMRAETISAVLPFIGGAARIHERITLGAAVYPTVGQGASASYRPAPEELPDVWVNNNAAAALIEVALPVSIRIFDNLSIGAMWRATYMTQSVSTALPAGAPAGVVVDRANNKPVTADLAVTGLDFTGFQLGMVYTPGPGLRLGFSYRSKVMVTGTGTTTTTLSTPISVDTRQEFGNPHIFRGGFAVRALHDKLMIAMDFKYLMYAEAFRDLRTVTIMNGQESTRLTPAHWKDSYSVQLGSELALSETWRARAGYALATMATPNEYASAFMAPPGISHLFSVGLGIRVLDELNVDVAAAYASVHTLVEQATEHNAGVGVHAAKSGMFSLSATYRL